MFILAGLGDSAGGQCLEGTGMKCLSTFHKLYILGYLKPLKHPLFSSFYCPCQQYSLMFFLRMWAF